MKNLRFLLPALTLTAALTVAFTSSTSALAGEEPTTRSTPVRIVFQDWSKREAGEYIQFRDSVLFGIVDLGYRNYRAKCKTTTVLESAFSSQIQLVVQLTCTGMDVDDESLRRFISTLKDELKLEIYPDTPVSPRDGGAGVRN